MKPDYIKPDGTGVVQGDTKPMPMNTAVNSGGYTDGADISQGATNSLGSMGGTGSDPADQCSPSKP